MTRASSIMVVAGEASGDLHGAGLCAALRTLAPGTRVFGMGGERMRAAGAEIVADVSRGAVVGGTEAVSSVPALYRVYRRLRRVIARERPGVLVLIDFPEFNLRLARAAWTAGVPVVYFVPPQIWAWRRRRIKTIRRLVSLVLAVFPFERALYRDAGVPVEFVGHPLLDALVSAPTRAEARRALGIDADGLVIGLLPGSRSGEATRMLPLMREAAVRLSVDWPQARFVLAQAPTLDDALVDGAVAGAPPIRVVRNMAPTVMRAADLLLVTSGTATLEAALLGTPMIVCYRLSHVSELLAKLLVRVPWISLANLTLGRAVVPELFLRRDVTVERLVDEARRLIESPEARDAQRTAFAELRAQLGEPGVGRRAAQIILGGGLDAPLRDLRRHRLQRRSRRSTIPMIARRALTTAAPLVAAGAVKLLGATLRVTVSGDEALRPLWEAGQPLIYVVWHGRTLLVPWLTAWLRPKRGARAPLVLASRSRDGGLAACYVARFGLTAVRGSSSRGGDAALRRLVAAIRSGTDVAIVPDGPRGPGEQLQPGVVTLAALTGAPIVPLAVGARPGRLLRTWDRFLVPLPFARCALAFGPTLRVERDADRARACTEVERALRDITARADALAAGMPGR